MKVFKWITIILILIFGGFSVMVLSIGPLRSQIMEKAGLAVAQTPILWNNVKDAAVGDNQTTGIVVTSPYLFDGVNYDPARGTVANGMAVDVTRVAGYPTSAALADGTANPTTYSFGSYMMIWNGATWNRVRYLPTYTTISATFTTDQVAVDATAGGILIKAINLNRRSIIVRNQGTVDMYVGVTGLTPATGLLVKVGEAITLDRTTAAIYGITAAGATTVGYLEE